jgi:hypothetical protein
LGCALATATAMQTLELEIFQRELCIAVAEALRFNRSKPLRSASEEYQ